MDLLHIAGKSEKRCNHFGKQFDFVLQNLTLLDIYHSCMYVLENIKMYITSLFVTAKELKQQNHS